MVEREVEEWTKGSHIGAKEPHITIYSLNQIAIPAITYREWFSGAEAVTIQYSTNTNEIGIKPANVDDSNAYILGGGTKTINCKSFLQRYDLLVDESTKYPVEEDSGVVWVDVGNPLDQ